MSALLEIRGLDVCYGEVKAVHGIDLSLGLGEIVTIIGPNGAGKTTTLNAIMGVLPSSGSILLEGTELGKFEIEQRVARGLCLVPEQRALFGQMSVEDNLILGGYSWHRLGSNDLIGALPGIFELFPRLKERRRQIADTLSGGERQMLAIGRALMARPKLLMLDEPSLGLAPRIVHDVLATVAALRERGVSILVIEQNARAALQIADYGYVLEMGSLVLEGAAQDLAHSKKVVESYLGLGKGQATSAQRDVAP
jgi:branched-chain amino acid transport system ATP-binding protein